MALLFQDPVILRTSSYHLPSEGHFWFVFRINRKFVTLAKRRTPRGKTPNRPKLVFSEILVEFCDFRDLMFSVALATNVEVK